MQSDCSRSDSKSVTHPNRRYCFRLRHANTMRRGMRSVCVVWPSVSFCFGYLRVGQSRTSTARLQLRPNINHDDVEELFGKCTYDVQQFAERSTLNIIADSCKYNREVTTGQYRSWSVSLCVRWGVQRYKHMEAVKRHLCSTDSRFPTEESGRCVRPPPRCPAMTAPEGKTLTDIRTRLAGYFAALYRVDATR